MRFRGKWKDDVVVCETGLVRVGVGDRKWDPWWCLLTLQRRLWCRSPPNLLRQETEGTKIYLAVLNKTASGGGDEARDDEMTEQGGDGPNSGDTTWKGGEQELREEAERRLVSFCGDVLREVATLQPGPSEAVESDVHRALDLRSPVTVQVVGRTHMAWRLCDGRVGRARACEVGRLGMGGGVACEKWWSGGTFCFGVVNGE